jgi:hypothetical protein
MSRSSETGLGYIDINRDAPAAAEGDIQIA